MPIDGRNPPADDELEEMGAPTERDETLSIRLRFVNTFMVVRLI